MSIVWTDDLAHIDWDEVAALYRATPPKAQGEPMPCSQAAKKPTCKRPFYCSEDCIQKQRKMLTIL